MIFLTISFSFSLSLLKILNEKVGGDNFKGSRFPPPVKSICNDIVYENILMKYQKMIIKVRKKTPTNQKEIPYQSKSQFEFSLSSSKIFYFFSFLICIYPFTYIVYLVLKLLEIEFYSKMIKIFILRVIKFISNSKIIASK